MSTDPPSDPLALDRYVAGDASAAERTAIEQWLAEDPARSAMVDALARTRGGVGRQPIEPASRTVDEQWARMAHDAGLDTTLEGAQTHVTHGGRPLMLVRHPMSPHAHGPRNWPERGELTRWIAGATVGVVALGAVLVLVRTRMTVREPGTAWITYVAAAGQRASVTLPDGTRAKLAPATMLGVPTEYAHGLRTVKLEGEAYFAVVHDAAHPFMVRAEHAVITDLGTEFDVRAYAADAAVRVAVADGRVSLTRRGGLLAARGATDAEPLARGDVATVSDTGIAVTHGADVAALSAWVDGRLVFRSTPVPDMLADLGRWYDLAVTLADSSLRTRRVTATFGTEPLDSLTAELAVVLDARVVRRGRRLTISPGATGHDSAARRAAARTNLVPKAGA